jgi:hypothetical protein
VKLMKAKNKMQILKIVLTMKMHEVTVIGYSVGQNHLLVANLYLVETKLGSSKQKEICMGHRISSNPLNASGTD